MRPVPIKREDLWPGARVIVAKAPPGSEESIQDVEVVYDSVGLAVDGEIISAPRISVRVSVSEDDWTALGENPYFWISFISKEVVPFQVGLLPEGIYRPTGEGEPYINGN